MSESQLIEYKESLRDEYLKWICASFAETLMQKHRSLPHNPDIANTFFRAGFIESWGRGVEKICRLCKEYGISEPEYTVHPNDIMMMFKANMIAVAQKDDTVNAILALIKQNPSITYEALTEKTGKSRRTISRIITELKTTGTIARVGSDKTGHWMINQ